MKFDRGKFESLVSLFAPMVLASLPGDKGKKIAPYIPVVINGIHDAQAIPGASGAEKKQHVLALVNSALAATSQATGKDLHADDVTAIASEGIDAVIGVVKVLHQTHGVPPGVLVPPPRPATAAELDMPAGSTGE